MSQGQQVDTPSAQEGEVLRVDPNPNAGELSTKDVVAQAIGTAAPDSPPATPAESQTPSAEMQRDAQDLFGAPAPETTADVVHRAQEADRQAQAAQEQAQGTQAPAEPEQATPEPYVPGYVLKALESDGQQHTFATDQDALDAMVHSRREVGRLQGELGAFRQFQQDPEFQQLMARRQQPQAPVQQEPEDPGPEIAYNPPVPYKPEWADMFSTQAVVDDEGNPTGQYEWVARQGTPPDELPQFLQWRQYHDRKATLYANDPLQREVEVGIPIAEWAARREFQALMAQERAKQSLATVVKEHRTELFDLSNPGQVQFTPVGQTFVAHLKAGYAPQQAWQTIEALVKGQQQPGQPAATAPPAPSSQASLPVVPPQQQGRVAPPAQPVGGISQASPAATARNPAQGKAALLPESPVNPMAGSTCRETAEMNMRQDGGYYPSHQVIFPVDPGYAP